MKFLKQIAYTLFVALLAACQGTGDPILLPSEQEKPVEPIQPQDGTVTLKADKTTLRADNEDVVTFTVLYGSEEISTNAAMELVATINGAESSLAKGVNTYKTDVSGTHVIKARYTVNGETLTSQNSVTLTATSVTETYILSVDKTTIEADGIDKATFTLTDPNGKNLVADANELGYIYFKNVETGENLTRRSDSFSMPKNGVYTFSARYKSIESSNTVTITVQNRQKYERYHQTVGLYKCTGAWCGPCAVMANYLENVSDMWRDHMAIFAAHSTGNGYGDDPFAAYSNELGATLLSRFGGQGYPFLIYDLYSTQSDSTGGSTNIENNIRTFLVEHPATCGVAIRSTEVADGKLTIRAALTSQTGGEYDMGYLILVDNQRYAGGTIESGIYNDIICGYSGNLMAMSDAKFNTAADEEVEREWVIENFNPTFKAEDMRVVVFALSKTSDRKTITDNMAICKLGESIDYRLNE